MQKLLRRLHKKEEGFTLVELMVVVVIIGVLVAIAIPIFQGITADANRNTTMANLRTIGGAVSMYQAEHGALPTDDNGDPDIEGLVPDNLEAVPGGPDPLDSDDYKLADGDSYQDPGNNDYSEGTAVVNFDPIPGWAEHGGLDNDDNDDTGWYDLPTLQDKWDEDD